MRGLPGALDNEIHTAIERFLRDGVHPDVTSVYNALQKSNSSLKRKPKKLLQGSIERVLDFMSVQPSDDSEAAVEGQQLQTAPVPDLMNRSLRENLAPSAPQTAPQSPQVPPEDATRKRRMANGEPLPKRKKTEAISIEPPSDLSLRNVGGMEDVMKRFETLLVHPLVRPDGFERMKINVPNGILLHGPPGCGKTMITRAFAAMLGVPFIDIAGPSIVSGMSGESEKAIRERFDEAKKNAPCIVFIDEIDAIASKRETSNSQMEKRIVTQLLISMDELSRDTSKPVIVLAATNRPDSIDPALRRGGRFSTEINIRVPSERVRESILKAQVRGRPVAEDVDFKMLAKMTAGFVGADLQQLVDQAASWQLEKYYDAWGRQMIEPGEEIDRGTEERDGKVLDSIYRFIARKDRTDLSEPEGFEDNRIHMASFLKILPDITPSSKREGFTTTPEVSWDDIGALKPVRHKLQTQLVAPIKSPEIYAAIGLTSPAGVLLWGPPGCGKTLLAKAVAAESKANFISVKGPELLDKFVGESEAAVRRVFTRARSSVPCVIFFDELDALVPRRDGSNSEVSARVVNTLLAELDGLNQRNGIWIIAATNRPDMIDEALLRPGRIGSSIFVDLPGPNERADILTTLLRGKPVDNLEEIAQIARDRCKDFSGADLEALWRAAGLCCISRGGNIVKVEDFTEASTKMTGSVGNIKKYYDMREQFGEK
ncbi:Ribosome biogenesis ATPase rix7 [Vermiconidia calcicola]|uniref:Ribosome biogenesis ATPase rix7 n=1 Tax=Vermiconidia calcicola TaxID=1690605 RepID=A0ACC3MLD7_9PEZI|nr:Ribosome biogenesis ATPase rix7 [Vermiconidia calcicola]